MRDYLCLRPKSAEEYNRRRTHGSPCWYTAAAYNDVRCWRSLPERLGLPVFSGVGIPKDREAFHVNVCLDNDLAHEMLGC